MTAPTSTIISDHNLIDPKYGVDTYFNNEAGINHVHPDAEYASEFGTDRVISSAKRIAFDSARATGLLNAEFGDFLKFDINIVGMTGTTITTIFTKVSA